jgi:hypothetical protein
MASAGSKRLLFFCQVHPDRGSARDMVGYVSAARALGHEILLYGPQGAHPGLPYTESLDGFDAAVFVVEYTSRLQYCDEARLEEVLKRVPRSRRVVIDCDGRYNDCLHVEGDSNHRDQAGSRRWTALCDRLADTILQPTPRPLRPNVRTFYFHGYDSADEEPLAGGSAEFDLLYVGNNWFRWQPLRKLLGALEPVRGRLGRLAVAGHGWGAAPPWDTSRLPPEASSTDPEYLRRLGCEILPPVPFEQVVRFMGRGRVNPVVYRPLFDRLGLLTCRAFETPAAATVPLFAQERAVVRRLYGAVAEGLVLGGDPAGVVLDVAHRPGHYAALVGEMRRHLAARFSYRRLFEELIEIALG